MFSISVWFSSCCRVGVPKSTWSWTCFLGWTCIIQILHNFPWRQDILSTPWSAQRAKHFGCGIICKKWHFNIRYRTLYHVALLLDFKLPSGMTSLWMTFCVALLNVREVTWYMLIIIFTWNDNSIAVGCTSVRLATPSVCCYTIWHSECSSSASIVLLHK